MDYKILQKQAIDILQKNSMGEWTLPTSISLYPHQWLWDTFFCAIGQRHYDIERAKNEIRSPFRAQWRNGMVPHVIFSDAKGYHAGPELWQSIKYSKDSPRHIQTTGVTQPAMAAEAIVKVGQMLSPASRRMWYAEMYPKVLAWHQWFYRERNPRGDGLVRLFLSWESGMDNSPPLMTMLHKYAMSQRVRLMKAARIEWLAERRRLDTKEVPADERIATLDLHAIYDLIRGMRRKKYDYKKILLNHKFQVIDLAFNCILMRANQHLADIAAELSYTLPADIRRAIRLAPHALETLWDDEAGYYYSRDALSGKLITVPSIATFMPLYAGVLPKERVNALVSHMHDPHAFGTPYPLPSAPVSSQYFNPHKYWQGPTWVNTNWLIIDGLRRNGRLQEAQWLTDSTIKMVAQNATEHGLYEYYSPHDASVAGAPDFSWTAALILDLLNAKKLRTA